jgi:hypothetical protein
MRSPVAVLKSDWRHFKEDPPGERFERQHERANRRSKGVTTLLAILGAVFVAGGLVMLFIPGPGLAAIGLGLALIACASRRLARALDRAEPALRRRGRAVKARWKRR